MMGHDVGFGSTRGGDVEGEYTLVFEHEHEQVGLRAAALALETVQQAFDGVAGVGRRRRGGAEGDRRDARRAAAPSARALRRDRRRRPRRRAASCCASGSADESALVIDVSPAFLLQAGLPYARSSMAIILDAAARPTCPPRYQEEERATQLVERARRRRGPRRDGGLPGEGVGDPGLRARVGMPHRGVRDGRRRDGARQPPRARGRPRARRPHHRRGLRRRRGLRSARSGAAGDVAGGGGARARDASQRAAAGEAQDRRDRRRASTRRPNRITTATRAARSCSSAAPAPPTARRWARSSSWRARPGGPIVGITAASENPVKSARLWRADFRAAGVQNIEFPRVKRDERASSTASSRRASTTRARCSSAAATR